MTRVVYLPTVETGLVNTQDRVERLERRPLKYVILEEIKVFADNKNVLSGDGRFKWEITDDLWIANLDIVYFKVYVTTPGGACTVRLWNDSQGVDVLSSPLTIPAGQYSAKTDWWSLDGIDETTNLLQEDDRFWLNIDTAGGMGLGFAVGYGKDRRP